MSAPEGIFDLDQFLSFDYQNTTNNQNYSNAEPFLFMPRDSPSSNNKVTDEAHFSFEVLHSQN